LRGWYGNGLKEKAAINQLLSWYQGTYRPALSKIMALKFGSVISGNPVKASDLAAAETKMKETLTFLNTLLSKGNTYLVGSNLTIADLLIFH
jgi:glutathione S-transferase